VLPFVGVLYGDIGRGIPLTPLIPNAWAWFTGWRCRS
jgi:hypothetical protein